MPQLIFDAGIELDWLFDGELTRGGTIIRGDDGKHDGAAASGANVRMDGPYRGAE